MSNVDQCVLLYATIHDVMRAEKLLIQASLWRDLVPTPRQLSSDCGMALALRIADLAAALDLLAADGLQPRVYRECDGFYEPVE